MTSKDGQYTQYMGRCFKTKRTSLFSYDSKCGAVLYCRHKYFIFIYYPSLKCYLGSALGLVPWYCDVALSIK